MPGHSGGWVTIKDSVKLIPSVELPQPGSFIDPNAPKPDVVEDKAVLESDTEISNDEVKTETDIDESNDSNVPSQEMENVDDSQEESSISDTEDGEQK